MKPTLLYDILRHRYSLPALLLVVGMSSALSEPYKIAPGDVVDVSVLGLPTLNQTATVGDDGSVALSLFGSIQLGGLTLEEAQAKLRSMEKRSTRQITPDGRESMLQVYPESVMLSIHEYRPVYVDGDVAKPGEQVYRPGMTVRQAVSLAGGYDIVRFRGVNPFIDIAELRSTYEQNWRTYAEQRASVNRLKAELAGRESLAQPLDEEPPIAPATLAEISSIESDRLALNNQTHAKDQDYFHRVTTQIDAQVTTLIEQKAKSEESLKQQAQVLETLRTNYNKGLAPISRISDEERAFLMASDRLLQIQAQVMQAQREREELQRDSAKLDADRRLKLMTELQAAELKLSAAKLEIQSIGERMLYVGAVKSQLLRSSGEEPLIEIYRAANLAKTVANEDARVMPGDVIRVSLTAALRPGDDEGRTQGR